MLKSLVRTAACALMFCAAAFAAEPAANGRLVIAIGAANVDGVRAALSEGADANYLHPEIRQPLLVAALAKKQPAIAMLLLDHGADAKAELVMGELRVPALLMAIKCDDPALIAKLIERGADPAAHDNVGNTALTAAAWGGRAEIVRALVANGVSPRPGRWQGPDGAVVGGVMNNDSALVQVMLDHGADPGLAHANGLTPLQVAQKKHYDEIIAALRKAEAK